MAHGSLSLKESQSKNLLATYNRFPVELVKGNGAYVYDSEGNEYLDFLCGIAVTSFGHCNPEILKAASSQLDSLWHTSNLYESSGQAELAEKICDKTGLAGAFFCNSGTEANEAAIKFARKWGGERTGIISTIGGFHGRTMGALSATGKYKLWEGFQPLTPGFKYVPYNNLEAVEYSIDHNTVAIMVEPIQGENGIVVPSEGYLKGLRELCDKHNLLLILDEVQAGMGRTGKLFCYQWEEIIPDIVTSAKGIANGLPLGAVFCSEKVAPAVTPGCHGSTFGGNPVAIAAANKVIDLITEEQLHKNIELGNYLVNEIKAIGSPIINDVRGKGLMIGIVLNDICKAGELAKLLLKDKVLVGTAGDKIIRLLPPFIISNEEIDEFINRFKTVLQFCKK